MDNLAIIIDDAISKGYQNKVQEILNSYDFPWHFMLNVTSAEKPDGRTGFSNIIFSEDNKIQTKYMDILSPILYEAVGKFDNDQDIKKIFRIKAGMFVKNQTEEPHLVHVDRPYFHYTMLYYVNDSDGSTQLYDGEGGKVVKEIEPKKGRAVILDGNIYHASSCPKNHANRIVINYNFLI